MPMSRTDIVNALCGRTIEGATISDDGSQIVLLLDNSITVKIDADSDYNSITELSDNYLVVGIERLVYDSLSLRGV